MTLEERVARMEKIFGFPIGEPAVVVKEEDSEPVPVPAVDKLTFAQALEALLEGKKVHRPGWKGYWVLDEDIVKVFREEKLRPLTFTRIDLECADYEVLDD